MNKQKLPLFFKPIFWSYDFSKINLEKDIQRIVINTINYGDWEHWQWIYNYYGRKRTKNTIINTPASEFRKGSFRLICLLLDIRKNKYETRGDRIRAEKKFIKVK